MKSGLGCPGSLMDGISADFPAKADIGVDGIGHEKIALEHHANAAAQDIVVQAAQGYPGEQDLSLIRVVEGAATG